VVLTSDNKAKPTFTAPLVTNTTNLIFQLIVNNGNADSNPAYVSVTVMRRSIVIRTDLINGTDNNTLYISFYLASTLPPFFDLNSSSIINRICFFVKVIYLHETLLMIMLLPVSEIRFLRFLTYY